MSSFHPLRIQDILIAGQLIEKGSFFDTSLSVTAGSFIFEHLIRLGKGELSPFLLENQRGAALGTLNFPSGPHLARLAHIAPCLLEGITQDDFLDLLDRMTIAAGEMGTFSMAAEADTGSEEIDLLRRANFATYSRQDIWIRPPAAIPEHEDTLVFIPADARSHALRIYDQNLPALMRGCDPTVLGATLIYMAQGKHGAAALVFIFSGARASLLDVMIFDPTANRKAILLNALSLVGGYYRSVYLRNRTFAGLTDTLIEDVGFIHQIEQVLMIKHLSARSRQNFERKALAIDNGAIPTVPSTHRFG